MTRGVLFAFWILIQAAMGPAMDGQTSDAAHRSMQIPPARVSVEWKQTLRTSRTSATLQVVVTPLMGHESPMSGPIWKALRDLHANYVRYVPWLPYPRLAVAELQPPVNETASWDFSLIDSYTDSFLRANPQTPVIINFSTIPAWMFKTPEPTAFPQDPNQITWDYTRGTDLRDPTMNELAAYYGRLVGWYTQGGFRDEFGKWHESGHHYKFDYWEVLNEPDLEHTMAPEQYTARYDAIVTAIRTVQPGMKFVGLALAEAVRRPDYFEYFLNPKNHASGIPLDMISYHFYATPPDDQPFQTWQYAIFDQSAHFVDTVRYIESIRKRLSPDTGTLVDEIGVVPPDDLKQSNPGYDFTPLPDSYWNLCAAQYAYLYGELAKMGVEAVGASALMQIPGFFPGVSMMDWKTATPNARYWGLKLIRENFGPGDRIVTAIGTPTVYVFGAVTPAGKKKVLLVNMRDKEADVILSGTAGSQVESVDQTTAYNSPASSRLANDHIHLGGFAVAVVTLPQEIEGSR